MWVSIWAFWACPIYMEMALSLNDNIAKVSIAGMVPQALQARAEEADVWATLLFVWCAVVDRTAALRLHT